jgi:TRAP-type transport system small permease protein
LTGLDKIINGFSWFTDRVVALCLGLMVVLVFGNVVLRYAFNSGITMSEELSRWLFVWVTFMGAVVALKERAHLGTDMLVGRLGTAGKKICLTLSLLLMLGVCAIMLQGSLTLTKINLTSTSAVMEVSMAWFYGVGVVFALMSGLIILRDLIAVITGKINDQDLIAVRESEEVK